MTHALIWLRRDLRLADNSALQAALENGLRPVPVYLHDTSTGTGGAASHWWLHHSLDALQRELRSRGSDLLILAGDSRVQLPSLARACNASHVFWNRRYEPAEAAQDAALKAALGDSGIVVQSFAGNLLREPWTLAKRDGTPYRVFTPFYRRGCKALEVRQPLPVPANLKLDSDTRPDGHDERPILPAFPWFEDEDQRWQPGEQGARAALETFLSSGLDIYAEARDRPDLDGVSRLSPHLHFGEISPHQVRAAVLEHGGGEDDESVDKFFSELGWREFSAHLLYHWPEITDDNLQKKFDRFPWEDDEDLQRAWQEGATGYPIVDAGMRQLWRTGYMHNRVRMITASFLVKNLLQDWRAGARWFWKSLLDADLANNSASWQWVAGCGADAAPYFRIFNPVTQGRKFDARGDYVRQYVPELGRLPDRYVHCPWEAPDHVLESAGVSLGKDYPRPIVDLAKSRERALDAFNSLMSRAS